jgi:hypothetical protein
MDRKTANIVSAIVFISLICFFGFASYTTVNGYFMEKSLDYFSTKTSNIVYYNYDSAYKAGVSPYYYKFSMGIKTESKDGFLVGNTIDVNFFNGFIEYRGSNFPTDTDIKVVLMFFPPLIECDGNPEDQTTRIPTEFDGKDRYNFSYSLNDVHYSVTGPKDFHPVIIINESKTVGLDNMTFLDIEPAYTLTQLKLTKAVVILTYWVVFFALIMATGQIKDFGGKLMDLFKDKSAENIQKQKDNKKRSGRKGKRRLPEIFTLTEKRNFVEILLVVSGIMAAFNRASINIFVMFTILAIIYIIWISLVKKRIGKRKFNPIEKFLNWLFSAFVGALFSALIASIGFLGSISSRGSIYEMLGGWLIIYIMLSVLLILVLGLRN